MKAVMSEKIQPVLLPPDKRPEAPPVRVIRALTLQQPYATLAIHGLKAIETRSWETSYRGLLAIHASKVIPDLYYRACFEEPFASALAECGVFHPSKLIRGATLGVVRLAKCERSPGPVALRSKFSQRTLAFGDFSKGRYLWHLENPKRFLAPHYCRGAQKIWLCELPETLKTTEEINQAEAALAQPSLFLPDAQ